MEGNNADYPQIMNKLGEMQGASSANFTALFGSLDLIRQEAKQTEERIQAQMARNEAATTRRFECVEGRLNGLEADNKQNIREVARQSAIGGGIGGSIAAALVSGALEWIKRM